MRNCKICAPSIWYIQDGRWNLCAYQKYMRPSKNRRPNSYYLGSAESPTSDFFQVWLQSSRSGDVVSPPCSPQVIWAPRPPSLYGRRLSRTVAAVVPARLAKISASCQNICGRIYFHHFLGKNQKPISAYKCPITSLKIRTWSQKLSKFSCNTFKPLNRGHPRFWPRMLKTIQIQQWVGAVGGERGGGGLISTTLPARACNTRSSLRLNSCWPHSRVLVESLFLLLPPFYVSRGAVQ